MTDGQSGTCAEMIEMVEMVEMIEMVEMVGYSNKEQNLFYAGIANVCSKNCILI